MPINGHNPINVHKVPVKQWNKWSVQQRILFNGLHSFMLENSDVVINPAHVEKMGKSVWEIISWNAAWMATDFVPNKQGKIKGLA